MTQNDERTLTTSRIALGFLKRLPREALDRLRECEEDTIRLVSEPQALNRALAATGCRAVSDTEINSALRIALSEYERASRHSIDILTPWDRNYPRRLLETPDYPTVLFRYGDCDLNDGSFLSIVGTRRCTAYGDTFVRRTVKELSPMVSRLTIISGLAFGIDAAAHASALEAGTPTIGVLAHGFGTIYPAQHRDLARAIREHGGCLLTEYIWGERPYRPRFLERNRIVAGLGDAVLVAESAVKGGAMSTANIAFSINRTLMALPGRISDEESGGCNLLIAQQKAQLVTSPADVAHHMGLDLAPAHQLPVLPLLFPEPEGEGKKIYEIISMSREPIQLDELCARLHMPVARLSALLGEMEFDGLVTRLPGNRYVTY